MLDKLIEDLIVAGLTEREIGVAIGKDQSTVNRIRRGKQRTDYETGVKLADLHRARCADSGRGRAAA